MQVNPEKKSGAFRFQNMWLFHPKGIPSIKQNWEMPARHRGLKQLWEKLHRLKQFLGWWNKAKFGNIFQKLKEEEKKVLLAEQVFQEDSNETNQALVRKAASDYQLLLNLEEKYWKQQANCKWLIEGDNNTKLFHNMVKRKRLKNKIQSILHNGNLLTNQDEIHRSAIEYFQSLLGDTITTQDDADFSHIPILVHNSINAELCSKPTREEVKAAVFSLNKEASASPDGYTAGLL